ncbi:hypothetical protein PVAP13_2KG436510, partial [Panicum virgatum]
QKPCLLPIYPPCFSLGQSDRPSRRDCQTASANLTCASTALAASTVTEQETSNQPHCRSHGPARPATNHLPGAG